MRIYLHHYEQHVGPGEDMTTVCNQEEADTRINISIQSVLGATSRWITGSGKDTARHQHQRTCMCSGSSTQCGSPSLRDPHWMRLNVCHEGALKCKRMWFSAWKKCSPRVTECMVELLDSPFQTLQMDSKFDALEELLIQICGEGRPHRSTKGGKRFSVRETRKWFNR